MLNHFDKKISKVGTFSENIVFSNESITLVYRSILSIYISYLLPWSLKPKVQIFYFYNLKLIIVRKHRVYILLNCSFFQYIFLHFK